MSILIKGMDKVQFDEILRFARIGANNCMMGEHLEIVEVPTPHGRLIDGDELKARVKQTMRYFSIKFDIDESPTVIEAEE